MLIDPGAVVGPDLVALKDTEQCSPICRIARVDGFFLDTGKGRLHLGETRGKSKGYLWIDGGEGAGCDQQMLRPERRRWREQPGAATPPQHFPRRETNSRLGARRQRP